MSSTISSTNVLATLGALLENNMCGTAIAMACFVCDISAGVYVPAHMLDRKQRLHHDRVFMFRPCMERVFATRTWRELRMLVSTATVLQRGEGLQVSHPSRKAHLFVAVYVNACTLQEGKAGLDTTMYRLLGAVSVLLLLLTGAAGRNMLQDTGNTQPTSFAAKKNANSEAVTSADAATRQALQNQKTVQLQGKQTQLKPHSTQKKTLQQVRRCAQHHISQVLLMEHSQGVPL